jgi:hypothetical protein
MVMAQLDGKLFDLLFKAIRNPDRWDRVLQHILAVTDAKAGIITLRDRKTCQIVNDNALEEKYHSPLIQGFTSEAVAYYLEKLAATDPWAEAQRSHHPHHPVLMSSICPVESVADTQFFDWLAKAGMQDTVVFELDRSSKFWTACNLFLEGEDPEAANRLLQYANTHFRHIKEAWQASQDLVRLKQSGKASLDKLGSFAIPACIAGPAGEVFRSNDRFEALLETGCARLSRPSNRLSVCKDATWFASDAEVEAEILRHGDCEMSLEVSVEAFEPDPLYRDKREPLWLFTFGGEAAGKRSDRHLVLELNKLSDQERKLADAIREGLDVKQAGVAIDVKRARAFEIWRAIRDKLGIESIHQLRLL